MARGGGSRVVIFSDEPGWHGRMLVEALRARALATRTSSLRQCRFDFAGGPPDIRIPGFEGRLPDAAFVRGVAGGTLEEVVLRLDFLHALEHLGIPVFNTGRAIERTVDKAMTTFLLRRHGIPTPRTWVCEATAQARVAAGRLFEESRSVVMKPVFGSQGEGVVRIDSLAEFDQCEAHAGVYYLQEYLDRDKGPYCDWRILVIEGRTALAMQRRSNHWVTNRAQGAECHAIKPDRAMRRLAEAAARAVDIDYAGVDLLRDRDGNWLVGEVNGIPAWKGLQEASGIDVGALLCAAFIRKIEAGEPAAA